VSSTISHIHSHDEARYNPEGEFEHPSELANAVALTRGEKLAALDRWEFQVERRLAAASEGMPTCGRAAADLKLLEDIRRVRETLRHAAA
jgi:hypothetical protein